MKSTSGRRRALTDAQVQRILTWNLRVQAWNEQRKQVATLRAFAQANHMNPSTLLRWLPTLDQKLDLIVRIHKWHCAVGQLLSIRAQFETLRGLAREFGVSENTIASVIRRKGEYKQVSPELMANLRLRRRARLDRLRRMNLY